MLFLGVDGGQSSTKAMIADETGRVLGVGSAGPCNHVESKEEGRRKLAVTVQDCVASALAACGMAYDGAVFESACFGMSGGPDDKREVLQQVLRCYKLTVTHDGAIALSGAMSGGPGIVVIAGTGSFAFGRNEKGEEARAGGWGYVFGDEGGAFDIVRQATRAMLREEEGRFAVSALTRTLLGATGTTSANEMLHAFYTAGWPRARVALLAQHVDQAAQAGDLTAQAVLRDAGLQLAQLASCIAMRMFCTAQVAAIGGVFRSESVKRSFQTACAVEAGIQVVAPQLPPHAGALIEAFRAVGRPVAVKL